INIVVNVARGLVVYPKTIEAAVRSELPFMATEEILMAAVQAGGDRQELHERLRQHSQAAAEQVKLQGGLNDLLDRLAQDSAFSRVAWGELMESRRYVGRAPEQVEHFVGSVVEGVRKRYRSALSKPAELRV